jgi:hypothetical protein
MFEKSDETPPNPEKATRWEDAMAQVEQAKDRLGKGVDKNIKETVAAFLVNGFPTRGSCEGHLEERFGKIRKISPYIDVAVVEPKERFVGESGIRASIAGQFNILPGAITQNDDAGRAYWDYISAHHIQETPEYQEAQKKNKDLKKRAAALVDEFYRQRSSGTPQELCIRDIGASGLFKIEGVQGFVREVSEEDQERYRGRLLSEQAEMKALTEFFKKKFFET